ncbi:MAG: sarcosine oxidase subunit gamma [Octadecabacter sp.]|nr:sarcosine oxidase subunit gamma [Octadecabacter sp.]
MHNLQTITALGGKTPRIDVFDHITIIENDSVALASVTARMGREAGCYKVLQKLLGVVPETGRAVLHNTETGFYMGLDQWMLTAPRVSHELIADQLKKLFGDNASVTEQSGAWVCLDIIGRAMPDMCERLCAVPVRQMVAGDVQRTVIHKMGCFVIRCMANDQLRILGPRSTAATLHHALMTAATSTA